MLRLVKVDPLDRSTGLLLPFLTQRVLRMARETPSEYDGERAVRAWFRRLIAGDPSILLLGFLREDGQVGGHILATIDQDGDRRWVLVLQARVECATREDRRRGIDFLDNWGRSYGATEMLMGTSRSPRAWQRLYGFKPTRVVMARPIGAPLRKD